MLGRNEKDGAGVTSETRTRAPLSQPKVGHQCDASAVTGEVSNIPILIVFIAEDLHGN